MVSLVPRPLPDFILQLWRKIGIKSGSGLGTKLQHGDVTAGVKCVQTSIAFCSLRGITSTLLCGLHRRRSLRYS